MTPLLLDQLSSAVIELFVFLLIEKLGTLNINLRYKSNNINIFKKTIKKTNFSFFQPNTESSKSLHLKLGNIQNLKSNSKNVNEKCNYM